MNVSFVLVVPLAAPAIDEIVINTSVLLYYYKPIVELLILVIKPLVIEFINLEALLNFIVVIPL